MSKFRIYSNEITATLDPDNASPLPTTLIEFDQDPIFGDYSVNKKESGRGAVIQTLGGVVIQDFGVLVTDEKILFSDTDALTQSTITALIAAYAIVDGQWFFTDGYACWEMQFSRNPSGFDYQRNLLLSNNNVHRFSYSIDLIVLSKEI